MSAEMSQEAMVHRLPRAAVVDRIAYLSDLVVGRRVAHVGFADAGCRRLQEEAGTWLHAHLAERARALVGLDVDEAGVAAARERGYEAYVVDCRRPDDVRALGLEPADIVLAGEVIEHLDDPGSFLEGLHAVVAPRGMLVITTPNAAGLLLVAAALAGYEVNHPDHVTLFTWRTLTTLMARHGWATFETRTFVPVVKPGGGGSRRAQVLAGGARAVLWLERTIGHLGAPFVADGLIVVARSTR